MSKGEKLIPIQNTISTHKTAGYCTTFAGISRNAAQIFSYLNAKELGTCLSVCKQWNQYANNEALWNTLVPEKSFGPRQWNLYFGDAGEAPPVPRVIHQILNAPCPFWPAKKVHETHLLTLIPAIVNGQPFTLNSLNELIQKPLGGGKATQYRHYWDVIQDEHGNTAPPASYWALMTKDVIPKSQDKTYDAQKQLLTTYSQKARLPYEIPHLLESAAGILMKYVQSGTRLYSDSPYTSTRCQERISFHPDYPLFVGGFAAGGLIVSYDYDDVLEHRGLGGCRRF